MLTVNPVTALLLAHQLQVAAAAYEQRVDGHLDDPTCPHGDPCCPCQDGDTCHYEPSGDTPAMACRHCGTA